MSGHVIKSSSAKARTLSLFEYQMVERADTAEVKESDLPDLVRSLFAIAKAGEGPPAEPVQATPPPEPPPPPPEPDPIPAPVIEPPAEERIDPHEIQKRAFEEGFAHGEKAGREMGERQMDAVLKRLAETVHEVGQLRNKLYRQVEGEVLQLALAIARKLVRREVSIDPEITLTLVKVAMSHLAEKTSIKVRLNPIDHNALLTRHAELKLDGGDPSGVILAADAAIDRGGCVIETEYGHVDARIEEQFKEIESGLLEIAPK